MGRTPMHKFWMVALIASLLAGCQQRVVRTKNSYAANAQRPTAEQQAQRNRNSHVRLRRYQREQAAQQSNNPLAWVGAFFGDLGDALFPPPAPRGLSNKESAPTTTFSGTASP